MIPTVVGILGSSISSLQLVFKALLSSEPWLHDPEVLPIPYRADAECRSETSNNLSFGIFTSDGVVNPHPPITRAVRMVAEALKVEGYKVALPLYMTGKLTINPALRSCHGNHLRMPNQGNYM